MAQKGYVLVREDQMAAKQQELATIAAEKARREPAAGRLHCRLAPLARLRRSNKNHGLSNRHRRQRSRSAILKGERAEDLPVCNPPSSISSST